MELLLLHLWRLCSYHFYFLRVILDFMNPWVHFCVEKALECFYCSQSIILEAYFSFSPYSLHLQLLYLIRKSQSKFGVVDYIISKCPSRQSAISFMELRSCSPSKYHLNYWLKPAHLTYRLVSDHRHHLSKAMLKMFMFLHFSLS